MKQASKNETDILNLINKIEGHLIELSRKVDVLMNRSVLESKPVTTPAPKPTVNNGNLQVRPNEHNHNRERVMHKAICADCQKECTIPFKPSSDRPVYCKDCFSRRKVISMSGMKVEVKPKEIPLVQVPVQVIENKRSQIKAKKKAVAAKKPIAKKKAVPKKK